MNDEAEIHARSEADGVPERFVPDQMRGQLVAAEHTARYRWATSFCDGRRVLDAGCGAGYGAELLNQAGAASVVGVDISEAALSLARSTVTDGVTLELGDVTALSHADDSFDLVVCFEVIEHVEDPERVLDELSRVLRPDGLLLLSSPNRARYVPGDPHHRHEYIRPELQKALERRFESARIISQHVMLASTVTWTGAPRLDDVQTLWSAEPEPDDEIYLLAMAGSDLPLDPSPVVALAQFAEPRRWLQYIEEQRSQIEAQTHRLRELEGREADRQDALVRLDLAERELASLRSVRHQLQEAHKDVEALREREADLTEQTADLAELDHLRTQLDAVKASKSWQATALLRRLRR
jgi:2-polyprenyl-3-methyl-5-hydroxy-6-metoxy-1,4-benzoquinol methylase